MPLVPGRRGAFGDWLKTEREKRYRTQADALADFRRLAGLVITPSEYAQWESGSRVPKDANPKRLALYAFFGSREDAASTERASDMERLIASNLKLADQIKRVMDYLMGLTPAAPDAKGVPAGEPGAHLPALAKAAAMSARGTLRLAAEEARRTGEEPSESPPGPSGRTRR